MFSSIIWSILNVFRHALYELSMSLTNYQLKLQIVTAITKTHVYVWWEQSFNGSATKFLSTFFTHIHSSYQGM